MKARSRQTQSRMGQWLLVCTLFVAVLNWWAVSQATDMAWLTGPDSLALPSADTSSSGIPYLVRIRGHRYDSASVHLFVSVMDRLGKPHTGLSISDFRVTAADSIIPIERFGVFADLPDWHHTLVLGLGLANSGRGVARAVRRSATRALFAELREEKPDYCALLTFSGPIAVPRLFTADPLLLQKELSRIHFTGEGLRLIQAFRSGRDLIRQTDTSGFAAIIMVCDAADSGSMVDPVMELKAATLGMYPPIFIATLAAEAAPWQHGLAEWSSVTGGEAYRVVPDREALQTMFGTVINTLQSQYVISVPAGAHDQWKVTYQTASGAVSATVLTHRDRPVAPISVPDADQPDQDRLITYLLLGAAVLAVLVFAVFLRSRRV